METTEKKEIEKNEVLKRGEFLRSLGLSASALMAFYCMGTLTSCSSGDEPGPMATGGSGATGGNTGGTGGGSATTGVTGTTAGASIDFIIDLTSDNYKILKTDGEFAIIGDTIVIHTSGANYVALSKACTHAGTTVQFRKGSNDIFCSNHGSEFNLNGSVKKSPAVAPLTVFRTTLSQNGNSLTVKA